MIIRTMFGRLDCLVVIVVALTARAAYSDEAQPVESIAHADIQQQPINEPDNTKTEGELDLKTIDKQLFKRLFVKRRKEHLEAVKQLQKMDSYERQYKMINMLAEKMFDVIESKKVLLENFTDSELKNISFTSESNTKTDVTDAISNVLENIALFGDVVLNLPDITQRVLRKKPKWNSTIRWSFEFLNRTQDLLDKSTLQMIKLALQELNITKRQANYVNPNRISSRASNQPKNFTKQKGQKNSKEEKKKKQQQQRKKKGPQITRVEL